MSATVAFILEQLKTVDDERERRASTPELSLAVNDLKTFQQRRFAHTYADLLISARYGAAARFFLDELYGPSDFSHRDAQFARVVPALVRLFPNEIVETVAALAELHALSERLDTAMAEQLNPGQITATDYIRAWQATGREPDRLAQIKLTLAVATRLDRFTRKPLLRNSLRLMRGPARASGLGELQRFLEAGFDTFRAMSGAHEFIATVDARERALASALFAPGASDGSGGPAAARALASLP
jgi:hypothetical protein